ncbi:hypothetical protein J7J00_24710 [Bacillus sp. ISL-4]|uniref:hypothetical protein n=1 Tax=Bacillus sp. ISL-4 TaxID=2819125 RepID=UPI001BEA1EB3|nr:hypothetical protein [Bacillus sp. ISL-4]MBT2668635.1 hypothetical protein [Bacillus sp. ISL-4]MBT2673391.1 hypothetical protein [Streptomyces sp. ISL-14]
MDDTEQIERLYSPGEVADYLGIERQTVTKYARLLEQNGYNFLKDEKGNRNYTDSNIMMFKELIKQRNRPGITLETAAKSIVAIYESKSVFPIDTLIPSDITRLKQDIADRMDQQDKTIEKQSELIRVLVERLSEKTKYEEERDKRFNERLDKIVEEVSAAVVKKLDQKENQLLLMAKEEVETTKKEVAAAKEEIEAIKAEKKGFFSRLFGK